MNRHVSRVTVGIILLVFFGVFLRLLIASVGFTYDLQSYEIVANIVNRGGNVYQETSRYNYGPVWFILVGFLYKIAQLTPDVFLTFRFLIVGLLTMTDVFLWYYLYKRYSLFISVLFFLNPLSIVITGYYSQFDNLALLLAVIALTMYNRSHKVTFDRNKVFGLILLGISLMTKHAFIFFPIWLAIKEKKWSVKFSVLVIPIVIFMLGFLPFIQNGYEGIKQNVFLYKSFNNAPFWQQVVPDVLKRIIRKEFIFIGSILIAGMVLRKKALHELIVWYPMILVTFSYAISEQYFAYVLPFIAIHSNPIFLIFTVIQSVFMFMVVSGGDLHLWGQFLYRGNFSFQLQILMLFIGILFVSLKKYIIPFTIKRVVIISAIGVVFVYGWLLFPAFLENKRIEPIARALAEGNYEKANDLYGVIEKRPPFAGSRFYEKLRDVRYSIEYYRKYRYAYDLYNQQSDEGNWKNIISSLQLSPDNFPYSDSVVQIIEYANQYVEKQD